MPLGLTSTRSSASAFLAISLLPMAVSFGCTLDDGSLSQTVAVDVSGDTNACDIRIVNISGDVVLEARSADQAQPAVAQISEAEVANSSASDAVFAWSAVVGEGAEAPAPSVHFDPQGTLVVDAGCADLVEVNIECVATLHAWAPEGCNLDVVLGTSNATTIVGFVGDLRLTAETSSLLDVDHDGTASLTVDEVSDTLRLCGSGEFSLDVNGTVEWCEEVDQLATNADA